MKIPHKKELKKLFAKENVLFAYLFGSRANGYAVKKSDYDFAVFLKEKSKTKRFDIRLKLSGHLARLFSPQPVDVIVLNDVHSTTLRNEIVNHGKIVFEKDESRRLDFELFTMNEYEDFLPFLRAYNEAYLQRV